MGYPMNSPFDDFGIAYVEGEDKGMFTSNRKGSRGDDIYEFVVPPKIYRACLLYTSHSPETALNSAPSVLRQTVLLR